MIISDEKLEEMRKEGTEFLDRLKDRVHEQQWEIDELKQEIERLNKTLEDIDTYIHLWKLEEIGEKTMLILNDILLIKNGMSDEVVRLKDSDKE